MFWKGLKKDCLDFEDLYRCPKNDDSDFLVQQLEKYIYFNSYLYAKELLVYSLILIFIDIEIGKSRGKRKIESFGKRCFELFLSIIYSLSSFICLM